MTDFIRAEYPDGTYIHRVENKDINGVTQGSAISSWRRAYDGQEVGGQDYWLSYSSITPTEVDVTIACSYTGNSQHGVTKTVTRDTTLQRGVVRGWELAFSDSGAFATSWKSGVRDGIAIPTSCTVPGNPEGKTWDFSTGLPTLLTGQGAGAPACTGVIFFRNTSGQLAEGCEMRLRTPYALKPTAGPGLMIVSAVGNLTPKLGSVPGLSVDPYMITFEDLDTVPTPDTITVLIDGVPYAAILVNGGTPVTTENMNRDGVWPASGSLYQITDGPVADLQWIIDAAAGNSDEAELRVWPVQYTTIRNEIVGGSYTTADTAINAAASGAGVIPASGVAEGGYRVVIPAGAGLAQSPVLSPSVFVKASFTIPSGA